MQDLTLPEQLQLLLENPQDGDVPTTVWPVVVDCIRVGMAWELERAGSVVFQDPKTVLKGAKWPPPFDPELAAMAGLLDREAEAPNTPRFIRSFNAPKGLLTDMLSGRLQARDLAHDKQTKQWLILSKMTHPLTEAGLAEKAKVVAAWQAALGDLQAGAVTIDARTERAWIGAWLLDTFGLLKRAFDAGPTAGRTANVEGVRSLVRGNLISLVLARAAYEISDQSDRPLDLLFGALDTLSMFDDFDDTDRMSGYSGPARTKPPI